MNSPYTIAQAIYWMFPTSAERIAYNAQVNEENRIAWQVDTGTLWVMSEAPNTWSQIGGSSSDLLSTLTSSDVSVTGTATLTSTAFGKMHVCSGTASNYTVTLPAVSGNTGKIIGFRMSTGLTKLVTIEGDGSETIDGALNRVMWKNEVAILQCDGISWIKIAGKTIPFTYFAHPSGDNTSVTVTDKIVPVNTLVTDNSGLMHDSVNNRAKILRSNLYDVAYTIVWATGGSTLGHRQARAHVNGVASNDSLDIWEYPVTSAQRDWNKGFAKRALVANDYIELVGYQESGANRTIQGTFASRTRLQLTEVPLW
jgi:hypothetical protein